MTLQNSARIRFYLWVAFFIWPFVTFLFASVNYRVKEYRIFILLFFVYYGLAFVINNPEVDANRYVEQLVNWEKKNFNDYYLTLTEMYGDSGSDRITDPFVVSIDYIVSRITVDQSVLFGLFAFLLGAVCLKCTSELYEYKTESNNYISLFYIFYFLTLVSIFNINGFRFWMACWVYFYGAYQYVIHRNVDSGAVKYFIVAFSSTLIHFSFILPVILLLLYAIIGNKNYIYYPLVAISFFAPVNFNEFLNFEEVDAPGAIRQKSVRYLSEGYEKIYSKNKDGLRWFVRYPFTYYFSGFALLFLRVKHKLAGLEKATLNLFSFALLMFAFTNFVREESQLIRFAVLFSLVVVALIVRVYKDLQVKSATALEFLGAFSFLLHALLSLRIGSESINALLFSPGLMALLQRDISVYDLIY